MKIKPHARLTRTLGVILKIAIVVSALSVLAALYSAYTYATLPARADLETVYASDILFSLVWLVRVPLTIITLAVFLWWVYRTNKNLRALSGGSWMQFTPGWSVGWFFIPLANLFKPYRVMEEIWNASHGSEETDRALVGWWWALWLISTYAGRLASALVRVSDDASGMAASFLMQSVIDGLDLAMYVVTLKLVSLIRAAYARNIVEPTGPAYGGSAVPAPPPLT